MPSTRLHCILVLVSLIGFGCKKEQQQDIVTTPDPTPTDTIKVEDPVIIPTDTIYLAASVMAADTGGFARIISSYNYSTGTTYSTSFINLTIVNDTLRLGNMLLLPVSQGVAHILPFKVWGTATLPGGYTYQVEGTAKGVMSITGGNLYLTIVKNINNSFTSEIWTYFHLRNTVQPLTKAHYTGIFRKNDSNSTDARLTIETDETYPNGVKLKELNRVGYINDEGTLVLPETPADSTLYGPLAKYTATTAQLRGVLLEIGQQLVYNNQQPQPQDYQRFIYVR
jgi:hypothetical protein